MVDSTIKDRLFRLGYSQLWLDSGVLTNDILQEQINELELGDDDNPEHYRYRTLTKYLNLQTSIESKILNQILRLLQSDSDKTMAGSATLDLLRKPFLSNEQFDTVANMLQNFGDWTIKQIENVRQERMKF